MMLDSPLRNSPTTLTAAPDQLPLFTYGTLRRGQENYMLLRGNTLAEIPARIEGVALYSLRAYPMLIDGDGMVHGDLMTLHPRIYSRLMADLDQLEGYYPDRESRFVRMQRVVRTEGGADVLAWVYMGSVRILDTEPHVLIPHGDWCRYRHDLVRGTRFGRFAAQPESDENNRKERS
ncbi:MAG: gamma-glutamylcyclotransferase [Anaerolineae bacterium]|nr:gamma-glutamylcyclotransferase [Anaerolineae bacterium]